MERSSAVSPGTSRPSPPLHVAPAWREVVDAAGWRELADLFAVEGERSLHKPGLPRWRERIRVALPDGRGGTATCYLKRFVNVPLGEQWRRLRGFGRGHGTAWVEWHWMHELRAAGVAVPEPIAFAEELRGPWERRSAVVMATVAGESLERWCATNRRRLPEAVQRELAALVGRFHRLGLAHRDLYLAHVFAAGVDEENPKLALIDLQRVIRVRRQRWFVKDLAALHYSMPAHAATRTDRLRWFKCYAAGCDVASRPPTGRLSARDRAFVRRILRRAEQMRRHDDRRQARSPGRTCVR